MAQKKPKKRKNVSQTIPNGTMIITNDSFLYGNDGNSTKTRMATVIDSNRKNEVAIVKYTTSKKNGRTFTNNKGFSRHGNMIISKTVEGNPITIDGVRFIKGPERRNITERQSNEIKRRNIKESKYKRKNRNRLRNLKGR